MSMQTTFIDTISSKTFLLMAFGALIALFLLLPLFVFCLIAFAPSYVAGLVDQEKESYFSKCVFMCNFSGVLPFALKIIRDNMSLTEFLSQLQDSLNWLIVLVASGLGWGIYYVIPKIVVAILQSKAQRRIEKLEIAKKALHLVWDRDLEEVKS